LVAVWYWLLMFVCATIVFVCQFVMTLLLFWVAYQGLKDFRDWWHAGKK
jgi:Na+/proline symporter